MPTELEKLNRQIKERLIEDLIAAEDVNDEAEIAIVRAKLRHVGASGGVTDTMELANIRSVRKEYGTRPTNPRPKNVEEAKAALKEAEREIAETDREHEKVKKEIADLESQIEPIMRKIKELKERSNGIWRDGQQARYDRDEAKEVIQLGK